MNKYNVNMVHKFINEKIWLICFEGKQTINFLDLFYRNITSPIFIYNGKFLRHVDRDLWKKWKEVVSLFIWFITMNQCSCSQWGRTIKPLGNKYVLIQFDLIIHGSTIKWYNSFVLQKYLDFWYLDLSLTQEGDIDLYLDCILILYFPNNSELGSFHACIK